MRNLPAINLRILPVLALMAIVFLPFPQALSQDLQGPAKAQPFVQKATESAAPAQAVGIMEKMVGGFLGKVERNFQYGKLSAKDIYMFFIGIILTLLIARFSRWFIENYASKLASKTETEVDDLIFAAIGRPLSMIIFSVGLYCSFSMMFPLMSDKVVALIWKTCTAIAAVAIAWAAFRMVAVVDYLVGSFASRSDVNLDNLVVPAISRTLKVLVVVFSVLLIGQNIFNINITTLLAGAGVAGLAVAFAAQDTIANVFGSIMVIIDQPFKAGEVIKVDAVTGQVEHIGFRSTKIRTLNGHQVTIPNKNMANATIENISRRPSIKHEMNLTLVYDTSPEKMEKAVSILKEIFDKHENMNKDFPPRIFFNSFKDWSLNVYVIVWYFSSDYFAFLDWTHRKNLEILKRFNDEGIKFAYPTHTTYLMTDPASKPEIQVKS